MTTIRNSLGIIGGTFDPIHFGHLRLGLEILQIFQFEQLCFVPCKAPVHKENGTAANSQQRIAMIQLAIEAEPRFRVDDREIRRESPSYMFETLQSFRAEYPNHAISLILGSDAFLQLPSWHHWQQLLDYCHLVIATRPGFELQLTSPLSEFFQQYQLDDSDALRHNTAGHIYVQDITALDIAATHIRAQLKANLNPRYLLPDSVLAYINQQRLYT